MENLSKTYPEIIRYEYIEQKSDVCVFKFQDDQQIPLISNSIFLYMEAKRKNVYFNKRLFIDDMGNLKNTLTSDLSFGNILDLKNRTAFVELIKQYSFQQYWHITKDMITVCRDCELRYMCVDNRPPVYIDAYWKQKTECPYNPYICKWKNENGYIPVEECGTYSKETGFVPDRAKMKELNKQLWEEGDDK